MLNDPEKQICITPACKTFEVQVVSIVLSQIAFDLPTLIGIIVLSEPRIKRLLTCNSSAAFVADIFPWIVVFLIVNVIIFISVAVRSPLFHGL